MKATIEAFLDHIFANWYDIYDTAHFECPEDYQDFFYKTLKGMEMIDDDIDTKVFVINQFLEFVRNA